MIRHARAEDSPLLFDLLLEIFEDMELPILKQLAPQTFKNVMVSCMQEDFYRYSYKNGIVLEEDGVIMGCCYGYKGELEQALNLPFQQALASYGMEDVLLFPDAETFAGEWYLDSLVTAKDQRGKGVAGKLLAALPTFARDAGESIIGLNCDKVNDRARHVYEKNGFVVHSEFTLSGHLYDHMQKMIQ